jgi:hypothetical protein
MIIKMYKHVYSAWEWKFMTQSLLQKERKNEDLYIVINLNILSTGNRCLLHLTKYKTAWINHCDFSLQSPKFEN